jgi:(p)ppGpp synthase/HD superfamily hydrolase
VVCPPEKPQALNTNSKVLAAIQQPQTAASPLNAPTQPQASKGFRMVATNNQQPTTNNQQPTANSQQPTADNPQLIALAASCCNPLPGK